MSKLTTDWNLGGAGDDIYAALVEAHQSLSEEDARRLDARLILLLANHVGDVATIREAIAKAKAGLNSEKQT
jgi:hypothetical protein